MQRLLKASLVLQMAVAGLALAEMDQDRSTRQEDVGKPMLDKRDLPAGTIRASTLIGTNVYNHEGKRLGEIRDIVLDESQQKIGYAVLSYGGLAGLGDKLFAMPHRMIQHSAADDRLVINLDEQTLRNAPGFDQSKWPTAANADYYRKLDDYYRDKPDRRAETRGELDRRADSLKEAGEKVEEALTDEAARPAAGVQKGEAITWNRRATSLIGANVENAEGDNLGEVKDLVLDWDSGKVRYAVLSYGGLLGMGDKLFAVPVDAFSTRADADKLVLNVSKEQLKNAPGFSRDRWPNMADPQWGKSVDEFYRQNRGTQDR